MSVSIRLRTLHRGLADLGVSGGGAPGLGSGRVGGTDMRTEAPSESNRCQWIYAESGTGEMLQAVRAAAMVHSSRSAGPLP